MAGKTIFAHKSHVHSCVVNVIDDGFRRYFAHMTNDEGVLRMCQLVARHEGKKVLYVVRVKFNPTFPIIGKKK